MALSASAQPYRVGGDVKAPVIEHRVEPAYTAEAARARISGIIIVEATIDETGHVAHVEVLKPLPFGLDQAAVDAVKQWTFKPATLNGNPVPVYFNLTVSFRLPESQSITLAAFAPRDLTVIERALAESVPEATQRLLIVNETIRTHLSTRQEPPLLARELDERNTNVQRIESLDLHRPFELIPAGDPISSAAHDTTWVMLALPAFSADGELALVEMVVTSSLGGELRARTEAILLRKRDDKWILAQRSSLAPQERALSTNGPFRVGGDVKAPVVLNRVDPAYTPEAERAGVSGVVIVEAIIDAEGHVQDVRVLKPLPFGLSDSAAAAVKRWEFRPGTLNGQPVPVIFIVTISFPPKSAQTPGA